MGKPSEKDHLEEAGIGLTLILQWISSSGWGGMDLLDLPRDKNGWQVVANVVMNLLALNSAGYFVTNLGTLSFIMKDAAAWFCLFVCLLHR